MHEDKHWDISASTLAYSKHPQLPTAKYSIIIVSLFTVSHSEQENFRHDLIKYINLFTPVPANSQVQVVTTLASAFPEMY